MNTTDLTQTPIAADGCFEVQLQKSGQILQVGKEQSILKALQGMTRRSLAPRVFAAPA